MRYLLLAPFLFIVAGCSPKPVVFRPFSDADGCFTIDMPDNTRPHTPANAPQGTVSFQGGNSRQSFQINYLDDVTWGNRPGDVERILIGKLQASIATNKFKVLEAPKIVPGNLPLAEVEIMDPKSGECARVRLIYSNSRIYFLIAGGSDPATRISAAAQHFFDSFALDLDALKAKRDPQLEAMKTPSEKQRDTFLAAEARRADPVLAAKDDAARRRKMIEESAERDRLAEQRRAEEAAREPELAKARNHSAVANSAFAHLEGDVKSVYDKLGTLRAGRHYIPREVVEAALTDENPMYRRMALMYWHGFARKERNHADVVALRPAVANCQTDDVPAVRGWAMLCIRMYYTNLGTSTFEKLDKALASEASFDGLKIENGKVTFLTVKEKGLALKMVQQGYQNAKRVKDVVAKLAEDDPDDEIRAAAKAALEAIEKPVPKLNEPKGN